MVVVVVGWLSLWCVDCGGGYGGVVFLVVVVVVIVCGGGVCGGGGGSCGYGGGGSGCGDGGGCDGGGGGSGGDGGSGCGGGAGCEGGGYGGVNVTFCRGLYNIVQSCDCSDNAGGSWSYWRCSLGYSSKSRNGCIGTSNLLNLVKLYFTGSMLTVDNLPGLPPILPVGLCFVEIDPCAVNSCHRYATCRSANGRAFCICDVGYIGNGITCEPGL